MVMTRDLDSGRTHCTSGWFSFSIFRQLRQASQQSNGHPSAFLRTGFFTIQRFGERAGNRGQFLQIRAAEKVRVPQSPPLQAALQELNDVLLFGKIGESHKLRLRGSVYFCGMCLTSSGMLPSCWPLFEISIE